MMYCTFRNSRRAKKEEKMLILVERRLKKAYFTPRKRLARSRRSTEGAHVVQTGRTMLKFHGGAGREPARSCHPRAVATIARLLRSFQAAFWGLFLFHYFPSLESTIEKILRASLKEFVSCFRIKFIKIEDCVTFQ